MSIQDADTTRWSAARIAGAVRRGEISAEVVINDHLERIRSKDAALGAFLVVRESAALNEARELAQRPDLAGLPLAGVPVAIKDNVDVAGEPTLYGSAATDPAPAPSDDELVLRLRRAGAIVIGKTRLPELAIWPFTESTACGISRNPWNPERSPGGSSGGSAAAVAAHMAPLALGSDGGGSIRIPSACCGLAGLKPGPGAVPLAGGLPEHWLGLSEFGPIARNVEDLALMFDVLRGSSRGEPIGPPDSPLRIAVSIKPPVPGARIDSEVRAAIEGLAEQLAGSGHAVSEAHPPIPIDFALRFMRRWLAGIAEDAEGLDQAKLEPRTRSMVRVGRWLQRHGWSLPAEADPFGQRMLQWLSDYDALLTPTLARTALPVGTWRSRGWITTALGASQWIYTNPWNLARLPAASVPAGLSAEQLPIGAQLVAGPGQERTLLALMAQVEALAPWPSPGL